MDMEGDVPHPTRFTVTRGVSREPSARRFVLLLVQGFV